MGAARSALGAQENERPIVIDGMGEIRLEYPVDLIQEVIDSGVTAVQVTLGNPALQGFTSLEDTLKEIAAYERHIDANREHLLKATKPADIEQARRESRLALIYLLQNTTPIGDDLDRLQFLYNLGVRTVQLTYNSRNLVGEGCTERTRGGVSNFGIQVIERMNDLGLLIDLSHANSATTSEAVSFSSKPVAVTHSVCAGVHDHHRAVSDHNLRKLGEAGGVIGICQINPFLSARQRSTLDDYLDHIDHAVKVAGIDHVGIGSDREHQTIPDTDEERQKLEREMARLSDAKVHWPFFVSELNHPRRMETIAEGLKRRGYASMDIDKILGGNFFRLFQEVIG
jgi:membrane dipeptidase